MISAPVLCYFLRNIIISGIHFNFTNSSFPKDLFTASSDLRLVNVKEGNLAC